MKPLSNDKLPHRQKKVELLLPYAQNVVKEKTWWFTARV